MKHAEKLIGRILFLEGIPVVSNLAKIFVGADVPKQIQNDHEGEATAIKNYNDTIRLAPNWGTTAQRKCWIPSCRTRKTTSTRSKRNRTRSNK